MKKIIAVIFVACLGWVAWPYYALYDLASALEKGDQIAIEHRIMWDQVRRGLRDDLNAMFMEKFGTNASAKTSPGTALGDGLALVLGPVLIDRAVDAYITPSTMASIIRRGKLNNPQQQANNAAGNQNTTESGKEDSWNWHRVKYAFFWRGPASFKAEIDLNDAAVGPLVLLFSWGGDWKLTRLVLPEMQEATLLDHLYQT